LLDRRAGVITPNELKKVIDQVKQLGYTFTSLDELVQNVQQKKFNKLVAITFDDGYKDLFENAYPILRASNIPFTLFLTTSTIESERLLWQHKYYYLIERLTPAQKESYLSKNSYYDQNIEFEQFVDYLFFHKDKNSIEKMIANMSIEVNFNESDEQTLAQRLYLRKKELLEMQMHGLSIEIHGHEHWPFSALNQRDTEIEIRNSVQCLMQELKTKPNYFCLPYGVKNNYFGKIIHAEGLIATCGSGSRVVSSFENNNFLPRIGRFSNVNSFNSVIYKAYIVYLKGFIKKAINS